MRRLFVALVSVLAFAGAASVPGLATAQHRTSLDLAAIQKLLKAQFERPDAPLAVEPIVIRGDYALAGWSQDGRGGRVLLRRRHHGWVALLCSGRSLTDAKILARHGVPGVDAEAIAAALVAAEARLSADRRKQFDSFVGTVVLDADGRHPPHHGGGGHGNSGN